MKKAAAGIPTPAFHIKLKEKMIKNQILQNA